MYLSSEEEGLVALPYMNYTIFHRYLERMTSLISLERGGGGELGDTNRGWTTDSNGHPLATILVQKKRMVMRIW